jgi:hypothetical protein
MNNLPAKLSPEVATWMRLQMQIAASRSVERVEVRTQMLDDFSEGVLELLLEVLPELLRANPDAAVKVMPLWRSAVQRHRALEAGAAPTRPGESQELLDARVMMFNRTEETGVWQDVANSVSAASRGKMIRRR